MSSTKHVIFIDSELSDFPSVIENLPEGSSWFKIDSLSDGISQIEEIAKSFSDLSSIQIVSHGGAGQFPHATFIAEGIPGLIVLVFQ